MPTVAGTAELVWFKGINWIEKRLEAGREYIIFGRPAFFNGALNLVHPEVESVLEQANRFHAEVQGVYSTTEKLNNGQLGTKAIYTLMCNLWPQVEGHLRETLPGDVMSRYGLVPLRDALYNIHFPTSQQALRAAEYRLKFEELFGIQLNILREQRGRKARNDGFLFPAVGRFFNGFYNEKLPFPLTGAQKRVIREIRQDTVTGHQMNRLLQGDVGSGKTLVAAAAVYMAGAQRLPKRADGPHGNSGLAACGHIGGYAGANGHFGGPADGRGKGRRAPKRTGCHPHGGGTACGGHARRAGRGRAVWRASGLP